LMGKGNILEEWVVLERLLWLFLENLLCHILLLFQSINLTYMLVTMYLATICWAPCIH
jgi:hypothetical protein